MKKKVLITGVTGMVGSHLVDYILQNTDYEIMGVCRWRSPTDNLRHLLNKINKKKRIYLDFADMNDLYSLQANIKSFKPDFVFHLAAQSFPQTSFNIPNDTLNTNIIGTMNLLNAVKEFSNPKMVHICSSSEVFGRVKKDKIPINEDCPFYPASPYAISKVGTDLIGKFFADAYNINVVITRMFTHTGPRRGDVFAESSFAKQIALIEKGISKPIIKVGNLNSMRTYADVRDAVRAYSMLMKINPNLIKGEAFNIGGNYNCTVGEMLKTLISFSKIKKFKVITEKKRLRPIDADLQIPDTRKFKKISGWTPKIKFKKTMLDLLNYWRRRISNEKDIIVR